MKVVRQPLDAKELADGRANVWSAVVEKEPYDVFAEGYATSKRRSAESSGLKASGFYQEGNWVVVVQRPMKASGPGFVPIEPGVDTSIAFAVWEGSNRERSAQKAVSGEFVRLSIDA